MAAAPGKRIPGPLASHISGIRSYLREQGYTALSSKNLLSVAGHLSRWLFDVGVRLSELRCEHVEAFFVERRRAGRTRFLTPRSLSPILQYLETEGAVSLSKAAAVPRDAVEELLDEYEQFLIKERGLQSSTARYYRYCAQMFLSHQGEPKRLKLHCLGASEVTSFILHESRKWSVGTTKTLVTAVRSLLRFLRLRGDLKNDLVGAVPAVAGWRQAGLPKFISPRELKRLLASCDRRTHLGRRDFAILLLLARLGLRRSEVAALELDDVHWREGELVLRGKNHTDARLPLPSDVGEAIAGYLQRGRPRSSSRALFLTTRPTYRRLSPGRVSGIVVEAAARANLPRIRAHRLRHTAATQMLRYGASLTDVALVLRHRSVDTTAIYAKVDHSTLRELAQPWPGGVV